MIGIDPGHHAAAIAVVEVVGGVHRIIDWRAIRSTRRKSSPWDVAGAYDVGVFDTATNARRWLALAATPGHAIAVEATPALIRHRASGGRGVQSLVTQAEAAGAIVHAVGRDVLRPLPDVWRRDVLRVAGNDPGAPRAALAAWGWLDLERRLPLSWSSTTSARPPEWAIEHVAEAACIAVWAGRQG